MNNSRSSPAKADMSGVALAELPSELQDFAIAQWGTKALDFYLEQLRYRVQHSNAHRRNTRNVHSFKYWEFAQEMVELLPALRRLATLPSSDSAVFDTAVLMNLTSRPSKLCIAGVTRPSYVGFFVTLHCRLDDALVEAAVRLFRSTPPRVQEIAGTQCVVPIPKALEIANELRVNSEFLEKRGMHYYALRSIQFLREVSRHQTSFILTQEALAGTLPNEVISIVQSHIEGGKVSPQAFTKPWEIPRPPNGSVHPCTIDPEKDECSQNTCSSRTWAEWLPKERCWVSVHLGRHRLGRSQAYCWRMGAGEICSGHHDRDFRADDWMHDCITPWGELKGFKGGYLDPE